MAGKYINVEIQNWNDLKSQFGLTDRGKPLSDDSVRTPLSAREISRELYKKVNATQAELHLDVTYGLGEGIALFERVGEVINGKAVYEYRGTAC